MEALLPCAGGLQAAPNASSTTASAATGGDSSTGSGDSNGRTISSNCHIVGCGERTSKRGDRHREVRLHVHRRPVGVARRGGGSGSAIGISRRRSRPCGGISTGGRPECRWEVALRTQPISHARWPPRRVALGLRPRGPRATRGTRRWRGAPGRRRDGDGEWG